MGAREAPEETVVSLVAVLHLCVRRSICFGVRFMTFAYRGGWGEWRTMQDRHTPNAVWTTIPLCPAASSLPCRRLVGIDGEVARSVESWSYFQVPACFTERETELVPPIAPLFAFIRRAPSILRLRVRCCRSEHDPAVPAVPAPSADGATGGGASLPDDGPAQAAKQGDDAGTTVDRHTDHGAGETVGEPAPEGGAGGGRVAGEAAGAQGPGTGVKLTATATATATGEAEVAGAEAAAAAAGRGEGDGHGGAGSFVCYPRVCVLQASSQAGTFEDVVRFSLDAPKKTATTVSQPAKAPPNQARSLVELIQSP